MRTASLDKKLSDSEANGETLSCIVGDEKDMKRELFMGELKGHLNEMYGEEKTINFFATVFHEKKWGFGSEELEEMLNEVKYSFLQDGEFF